ncbi:unnamed protein product [Camellia sinensis]
MSVEQSLNTRRRNKLLNEAQATMEVGKILGLDFQGKEKEVIGKLTELEQKDSERVEGKGVALGLRRPEKRSKVKSVIRARKVDFLLLQETKRSLVDANFVKSLWPWDQLEFMEVGAEGSAGGLLCLWNPQNFELKECCCSRNFILLSGGMKDFNELIDKLELVDMPMLGRQFTWCNAMDGDRWSRIDRFLIDPRWLEEFKLKQWGLPRSISDHCPILLMEDERDWGPKPFRFINAWCLHPKFKTEVKNCWEAFQVSGWASFRLLKKLGNLKSHLKRWNCEVFGNIEEKLKKAEDELHEWDLIAEGRNLQDVEIKRRIEIRKLVWDLSKKKEWLWLQKSRRVWAENGDKNTRFFHLMATKRQRLNLLNSVTVNGVTYDEPGMIKQAVENLLSDKGDPTLKDSVSGLTLLESFNYPCETFLPCMMLGLNTKTGEKHFLPSWKTEDPIAWKKWSLLTAQGYSNGFNLLPDNQQGSVYLTLGTYNNSCVSIVVLTSAGTVNIMHWDEQVKIWHVGWNVLVHPCDTHGVCGPSGLCNRDQSPNCECLKGFVPNSTEDSRKGNWAGGCVRNNELLCQKNTTSLASSGKAHNDGF